jgi:hypothetical protein
MNTNDNRIPLYHLTRAKFQHVVQNYSPVIQAIAELFQRCDISPEDGRLILAWIIGNSNGIGMNPHIDPTSDEMAKLGWRYAVDNADDIMNKLGAAV